MTAITPTEVSSIDFPVSLQSGAEKRRKMVFIRCTSTSGGTISIDDYIADSADIEGIMYQTTANAQFTSTATWSTNDLTIVDTGAIEVGVLVNLT